METSYLKVFTDYIHNNYDISNKTINEKYEHSIRVATLMIYLGLKLGMIDEDILLSFKIGLLHDLGRFREVQRNKDLNIKLNNLTFDHGAYSVKILFNDGLINQFDVNEKDYGIFKKALYFHNKKDLLEDKLSDRELLFSKMLRDMDKLDLIFNRSSKKRLNFNEVPSNKVINNYLENETINLKDLKSDSDRVILYLSFIKDLYFKESFDMAINNGYLDKLINIINIYDSKEKIFNELLEKINKRNEKEKKYVR